MRREGEEEGRGLRSSCRLLLCAVDGTRRRRSIILSDSTYISRTNHCTFPWSTIYTTSSSSSLPPSSTPAKCIRHSPMRWRASPTKTRTGSKPTQILFPISPSRLDLITNLFLFPVFSSCMTHSFLFPSLFFSFFVFFLFSFFLLPHIDRYWTLNE